MTLAEESSSSKARNEISAIAAEPINMVGTATTTATLPASWATRPTQRGIVRKELTSQEPTQQEVLEWNGKSLLLFLDIPLPLQSEEQEGK